MHSVGTASQTDGQYHANTACSSTIGQNKRGTALSALQWTATSLTMTTDEYAVCKCYSSDNSGGVSLSAVLTDAPARTKCCQLIELDRTIVTSETDRPTGLFSDDPCRVTIWWDGHQVALRCGGWFARYLSASWTVGLIICKHENDVIL